MEHAYFVVEGPHDLEVVGRLLRRRHFERVRLFEALDPYWRPLVPRTFPVDGDLQRRVPVPSFFAAADGRTAAIHAVGGISRIVDAVQVSFMSLDTVPAGLGIIVDADFEQPVSRTWKSIRDALPVQSVGRAPGEVGGNAPRAGIYVLPDNRTPGTLEDLLLECAEEAYPNLLRSARAFVDSIDPADESTFPSEADAAELTRPAGVSKATVGCIANLLRPGKAVQVSIQDNAWLRNDEALARRRVQELQCFVDLIIGTRSS